VVEVVDTGEVVEVDVVATVVVVTSGVERLILINQMEPMTATVVATTIVVTRSSR
jgi:hypothetical protein